MTRSYAMPAPNFERPRGCRTSNNFYEISSAHVLPPGQRRRHLWL